jgi:hypothetical protein
MLQDLNFKFRMKQARVKRCELVAYCKKKRTSITTAEERLAIAADKIARPFGVLVSQPSRKGRLASSRLSSEQDKSTVWIIYGRFDAICQPGA